MSLCTVLDAAVLWRDSAFASKTFKEWGQVAAHSQRALQSFLRSLRHPSQAAELSELTSHVLSIELANARTLDELVNASLRVQGVGHTLNVLLPAFNRRGRFRLSLSSVTNVLISFERYWRDWNSFESNQSIAEDATAVAQLLVRPPLKIRPTNESREIRLWSSLVATVLSRGDYNEAIEVLHIMENTKWRGVLRYRAIDIAQVLEIGVYSAIEASILLLQEGSGRGLKNLRRGCPISVILKGTTTIPHLSGGHPRRVTCTTANVIDFLSRYAATSVERSTHRIPVGVHLLQSLFEEAVVNKKYSYAADIIRLLERSRLVLDLDADEVRRALHLDQREPFIASIPFVRDQLARQWAAKLLGSSINAFQSGVADSLRRVIINAGSKKINFD